MAVRAVGHENNIGLYSITTSTVAGAALGYVAKEVAPVTSQETIVDKRAMINYCRKITNKAKVAEFKNVGIKTTAQDMFVKMIESKDKDAFTPKSLVTKVAALGGESSPAGKEFRGIIRDVNAVSSQLTKKFGKAYYRMLKDIRPTAPFIVAGAGIGFFAGFAHNVFKDKNA